MEINLNDKKPDIRYLDDMRVVVYDKERLKTAPNLELYYMYRGLKEKDGLRYDITIIPPLMLGQEFNKTKGHEHVGKFGEIYIVLEGQGIYLMQKGKDIIEDVYAVGAKKGDVIIIPPFYGHVTINPDKSELKMANWTADDVKSDYSLFEKKEGACYFAITQKSKILPAQILQSKTCGGQENQKSKIKWIKNKNYESVPVLRFEKPLKSLPKDLSFLKG